MEQGDLIRITDVQRMDGYTKDILNVYYYQVQTITAEVPLAVYAQEMALSFNSDVLQYVLGVQSAAVKHYELQFLNMTFQQEEATYIWETPLDGLVVGTAATAQLTYSFRLQRYSRLTRNGRKSIAGVPGPAITDNRELNPAYSALVSACSTALGTFVNIEGDTTDATLIPMIVRVPANPGVVPTVMTPVTQALFRGFGTQNSRKQL